MPFVILAFFAVVWAFKLDFRLLQGVGVALILVTAGRLTLPLEALPKAEQLAVYAFLLLFLGTAGQLFLGPHRKS